MSLPTEQRGNSDSRYPLQVWVLLDSDEPQLIGIVRVNDKQAALEAVDRYAAAAIARDAASEMPWFLDADLEPAAFGDNPLGQRDDRLWITVWDNSGGFRGPFLSATVHEGTVQP